MIWRNPRNRYMGAADLAPLAERGSLVPPLLTGGLVIVFALWALYAFSGAGLARRLPLLRAGLVIIGSIYTLRGLAVFIELTYWFLGKLPNPRMAAFSAVSLSIGIFYLAGVRKFMQANKVGNRS
jgi:hypothetical protein